MLPVGGADKPVGSPSTAYGSSWASLHSSLAPLGSEDSSVSRDMNIASAWRAFTLQSRCPANVCETEPNCKHPSS